MTIGLDFDNTIVSYDRLFHRVAQDLGVIPDTVPPLKNAVRDHLRSVGQEPVWTEMQGMVYGSRMDEAEAFPAALETIAAWKKAGHRVVIVSHKTRYPFLGEQHDLHAAARHWLEINGFFDPARIGMNAGDAFFEVTKELKLDRVREQGCSYFVDDLPEILSHAAFPSGVEPILFDPANALKESGPWQRVNAWAELATRIHK
jgi:FMN phosphatase YigB (HAD superfamily)